ncbi:hypothetical protein ABPG72_022548 [Tetrahymena utriculariae]
MCCFDLCIRGACCCCQAFCNDICRSLKRVFTLSIRQQMRLSYISLFFVFTLLTLFSMYQIPGWLGVWSKFIHCPSESSHPKDSMACLGISALYRMSFSLVILFSILILFCLLRNEASKFVNENFWFQKIIGLIALFILQMWIPNDTYIIYGSVSKVFGVIFALFQSIMCIDLFYSWSEILVQQYEQGVGIYEYLLYFFSFGCYASTFYLIYNNYQLYPCSGTQNLINILIVIAISILNLSPINAKPSILTCGAVCLFITYLNWSAMTNIQQTECNYYANKQEAFIQIEGIIGVFLIILSLGYITFGTADESSRYSQIPSGDNLMASLRKSELEEKDSDDDDDFLIEAGYSDVVDLEQDAIDLTKIEKRNSQKKDDDNKNAESAAQAVRKELKRLRELRRLRRMRDYKTNTYIYFHSIMILSSFYIVMLLTNYGAIQIDEKIDWTTYKTSNSSMNIKFGISYFTTFIYVWTVVAPLLFPDRQF